MDFAAWSFVTALAALVLALVSLTVSLIARSGNVRQLSLDVADLYDKVDTWTRRDRVRKLRDGKERALAERVGDAENDLPAANRPMSKQELRAMVFGGSGVPLE